MSTRKRASSTAAARAAKIARIAELMSSPNPRSVMRYGGTPGYTRTGGYYGRFGRGGEYKFFDTTLSFNVDATAEVPATGQLCLIPQGVTESTRVGRKCLIKSIDMKGMLTLTPSTEATCSTISWVYVVLDTQANGAAAAVSDVFNGSNPWEFLMDLANEQRFKVLKTFEVRLEPQAGATGAYNNAKAMVHWFHRCNIPLEFSSTTGAITEIRSNNIFLIAGCSGGDDLVAFNGVCRLRFSDN